MWDERRVWRHSDWDDTYLDNLAVRTQELYTGLEQWVGHCCTLMRGTNYHNFYDLIASVSVLKQRQVKRRHLSLAVCTEAGRMNSMAVITYEAPLPQYDVYSSDLHKHF